MKLITTYISIGDIEFDFVNDIQIKSSWKYLTDTAIIKMPKKVIVTKNGVKRSLKDVIKKGDKVIIRLGYSDGFMNTEFTGYVSSFTNSIPTVIECQDEMYNFKQKSNINKSWSSATLEDIVSHIAGVVPYEVKEIELGAFRISNVNAAEVLYKIREYGIYAYFRSETLHVGFRYPTNGYSIVNYDFQTNVPDKGNDLKFTSKDDIKIKLKATSILPTNEKIEIELGDPDGALRTLHYYNLSESELRSTANRDFEDLKYDGLKGSFISFGYPFVRHGDVVSLVDGYYPDNNGAYFVDEVITSVSVTGGFKRKITLGKKA